MYSMELVLKPHLEKWKKEFYEIVTETSKNNKFSFLDLKDEEAISRNNELYNDVNHLNMIGANAFTSLLKEQIDSQQ